ncbi:unnamed protein product [Rhodiola kirilowii]
MTFFSKKTTAKVTPNIVTYGVLLKGLCSTGNSRIALNLHGQIADGTHDLSCVLQMNFICYSTLIDGLCKDGLILTRKCCFASLFQNDEQDMGNVVLQLMENSNFSYSARFINNGQRTLVGKFMQIFDSL